MSITFRLLPSAALLAALSTLAAADGDQPAAAGYRLKNKSVFTISETARPPFWPIGYSHQTHVEAKAAAPVVDFKLDPNQYEVTSILGGSPPTAVISGRPYDEGQYLRLPRSRAVKASSEPADPSAPPDEAPKPPPVVKIRVAKILDGAVILEAAGQRVTVPLRRPALQMHKADDSADLLNQ